MVKKVGIFSLLLEMKTADRNNSNP